jgi:hypothetical protein
MRDSFKTRSRIPLRTFLLIILSICCAYYFYIHDKKSSLSPTPIQASMLTISPVVKPFEPPAPATPKLTTKAVVIKRNETFSELMQSQGFEGQIIQDVYASAKDTYDLRQIRAGSSLAITSDASNQFAKLEYIISPSQTLIVTNTSGSMKAEMLQHPTETKTEELG